MSNLRLKENPTLADLQQYVRDMVAERGFKDDVQNKFMMLIEEVGEFAKASRKHAGMRYATDVREQDLAGGCGRIYRLPRPLQPAQHRPRTSLPRQRRKEQKTRLEEVE